MSKKSKASKTKNRQKRQQKKCAEKRIARKDAGKKHRTFDQKMDQTLKDMDKMRDVRDGITKEIEPPTGFRVIGEFKGMMEFGEPILNVMKGKGIDEMDTAIDLTRVLWDLAISYEAGQVEEAELQRYELIDKLEEGMNQPRKKLEDLIDVMLERKKILFPPEVQPIGKRYLFIRQKKSEV